MPSSAICPVAVSCSNIVSGGDWNYSNRVIAGYVYDMDDSLLSITTLANIPSRDVLLAQLLGMLTNPMRSLAVAVSEIAKKNA